MEKSRVTASEAREAGGGSALSGVTVLVADHSSAYREGVAREINRHPRLQVVAEAEDGRAALDETKRLLPDVALLDLQMPGLGGVEVCEALDHESIGTRVLLMSAVPSGEFGSSVLPRGARGFVAKSVSRSEICEGVIMVADGRPVLRPEPPEGIAASVRERHASDENPVLTAREREVLRELAEGKKAEAIADSLHISKSTVSTHLSKLYGKLEVGDRAAAVAKSLRKGLIT